MSVEGFIQHLLIADHALMKAVAQISRFFAQPLNLLSILFHGPLRALVVGFPVAWSIIKYSNIKLLIMQRNPAIAHFKGPVDFMPYCEIFLIAYI